MAARDFNVLLPMKPHPWWKVFLGNESSKGNDLVDVANAILGTCNLHLGTEKDRKANEPKGDGIDLHVEWLVASQGFVCSLVKNSTEKSLNDPDSFLWFYYKDLFDEKEIQNKSCSK